MFKKILVPLDGSPLAEYALTPAFDLAMQNASELIVLNAVEIEPIVMPEPTIAIHAIEEELAQTRTRREAYLKSIIRRVMLPSIKPRIVQKFGNPAQVILETAAEEEVDLIVMSTHGLSGFARWVMGSVTERVLRHAPCPVFVVRQPKLYRKLLLPVDGSPLAEAAVEPAIHVALLLGADITVFSAEPTTKPVAGDLEALDYFEPGLAEKAALAPYQVAEQYVQQLAGRIEALSGLDVLYALRTGSPAEAILDYIHSHNIDLVVMATHGRTGLGRWVYGSVTEKVLRHASCNLLVVRPYNDAS